MQLSAVCAEVEETNVMFQSVCQRIEQQVSA